MGAQFAEEYRAIDRVDLATPERLQARFSKGEG